MFFNWKQDKRVQQRKIDELNKKIDRLEASLQKLVDKGMTYEVNIDHLNVHDPVLKSLTFRFDKLDVKEVSGALNLGNNFGVKVDSKANSQKLKSESYDKTANKKKTENKMREGEELTYEGMNRQGKGMTFRFDE